MRAITEKCPKMKNAYAQRFAEKGFAAAKLGKPIDALDDKADGDYADTTWQPGARMAWICGWEFGGGDIMRKIVVPQRQRLEEARAEAVATIARIDAQLAAMSEGESR